MKIGTPLSATAKRVMLLGSGELGKEVIIALQRLGVEVIVLIVMRMHQATRLLTVPTPLTWQMVMPYLNWSKKKNQT